MTYKSTIVSEGAIRDVLKEFFDPSSNRMKNLAMYTVDPWVLMYQTTPATDPNRAQDSPLNPEIVPQNKREFEVSLRELVKDIEDVDVPDLFKKIKEIVEEILEEEGDEEMKNKVDEIIRTKVRLLINEAKKEPKELKEVRNTVRKLIKEALPASSGLSGAIDYWGDEPDDEDKPTAPAGKKHRTVSDVGGVPWDKMKNVSGHQGKGTSGIEQYVYGKPREPGGPPIGGLVQRFANIVAAQAPAAQAYVDDETKGSRSGDPDKGELQMGRGLIIRQLVDEYIDYLASSDVLDDEEIKFFKDNPEAVETRPMFRGMLQQTIEQLSSQKDQTEEAKFAIKDLKAYLRDLEKFGD